MAVSPTSYSALAAGGETITVYVTNPTTSEILNWNLSYNATWLTVNSVSGTTENGVFVVTVQTANPASVVRSGTIVITAENGATATFTVYQEGS